MLTHTYSRDNYQPARRTPDRTLNSVRRTTSVDALRPDGLDGPLVLEGRGRDLVTPQEGPPRVEDQATVEVTADRHTRALVTISADPPTPGLAGLAGATVGPGFRARVGELVPEERDRQSILHTLLDDLPGASLVSGYALMHAEAIPALGAERYLEGRVDLCSGWAGDGALVTLTTQHGRQPTPMGPVAPPLERADDPLAWHDLPPLAARGVRRRRRLDLEPPPPGSSFHRLEAFFRDSHADDDGVETVLHEYTVTAAVDLATMTVVEAEAVPGALPWDECPGAVASAGRLAGRPLGSLRGHVRETFTGIGTCTHLNDVLRGVDDVLALARSLP